MQKDKDSDMNWLVEHLPAYVNGTASDAERSQVDRWLERSQQARDALAWHEALASLVRADVEAAPADVGWDRLQARLRADRVAAQPAAKGWLDRLAHWVGQLSPHHWMPAPALGGVAVALLAVVIGQGLWMSQADSEPDYAIVRGTVPGADVATGAGDAQDRLKAMGLAGSQLMRLNFRDRVSERDMRLLLIRAGAVIVGGPGQLGDYIVAVPAGEVTRARQTFQDSHLTESVQEVGMAALLPQGAAGSTGSEPGQPVPSAPASGD